MTRTVTELDVEELGPSLRYSTARVTKTTRSSIPAESTTTAVTTRATGTAAAGTVGGGST